MATTTLKIDGMTCGRCVDRIEGVMNGLTGILGVKIDLESGRAEIEYDETSADITSVIHLIEATGYDAALTE